MMFISKMKALIINGCFLFLFYQAQAQLTASQLWTSDAYQKALLTTCPILSCDRANSNIPSS